MTDLHEGDRVCAVHFPLDEGLRIWPIQDQPGQARVVRVDDDRTFTEVYAGGQIECQEKHPDAVWSINDNESVPPGTLGTVEHVGEPTSLGPNIAIAWDNGRRLHLAANDEVRKVDDEPAMLERAAAAIVAAAPRVERRTFEAKQHPEGSPERARLNEHPLTSEYMTSYRYAALKPQAGLSERSCWRTFRTKGEAVYWITEGGTT